MNTPERQEKLLPEETREFLDKLSVPILGAVPLFSQYS
jgi:hypothetical protein